MYILTVIPIKKGIQKEYLSYFSSEEVPLGSIVSVPVRLSFVDAIVIHQQPAHEMKSDIKSANYQIKKIQSVKGPSPFSSAFFETCGRIKEYSIATTGSVITSMLPQTLLNEVSSLVTHTPPEKNTAGSPLTHEKLIFQAHIDDRLSWYRTLIREVFAKKQSIFICLPTRYDIDLFTEALTKGIEKYVFVLHGDISKKKCIALYNSLMTEPHPILIIGTGMFLSIPRHDIETIIIEHESSEAYKQFSRPYIDIRIFAEVLASEKNAKFILGDTLLRPETLHRKDTGELGEVASPLFRLPHTERQLLVDMKEERDEKGTKSFTILSQKAKDMLTYADEHNESVFLYTLRKGLAGVTVCHDCGHTLLCPNCTTPIVLYGNKQRTATKATEGRIFMCNKCGHKETTEVRCPECSSWNLTPIGIGTDRVYDEVTRLFPKKKNIFCIDKDKTPTDTEARKVMQSYIETPGSILIGTELAFSYLVKPVTHSVLISLDGLLSIPSFNMTQKILHNIEKLHSMTERNLIIQTRTPENHILKCIIEGNILPLYREDLKEREHFGYPPFKRLIKITFTGTAQETEKARTLIDTLFASYEPQIFSAFVGRVKGQYVTNTVIKVDPALWKIPLGTTRDTRTDLRERLRELPPSFSIIVDPEDLL